MVFMKYKGYYGSIEYSEVDKCFHGHLQGMRAMVSYEGETLGELISDFATFVEDYLEVCRANDLPIEKSSCDGNVVIDLDAALASVEKYTLAF